MAGKRRYASAALRPVRVSAYREGKKVMQAELLEVKYLDKVDDDEFAIP